MQFNISQEVRVFEEETELAASAPKKLGEGAFCRFPNEVVRDKRLSAQSLVLLAHRSTYANDQKDYGVNEKALLREEIVRPKTGFGINAIRGAISECNRLGYIARQQNGRTAKGQFPYATDRLTLPSCGKTGFAGRIVRREWFDGSLSVKEMAVFLYMRAGTGRGPFTYAREIAQRFGWSAPTVAKVLRRLIDLGLVEERTCRDSQGQFEGATYQAVSTALWGKATTGKKPFNGSPRNGNPCNTRSKSPHGLPTEEPLSRTITIGSYASRQRDAITLDFSQNDEGPISVSKSNLLSWAEGEPFEDALVGTSEDKIEEICGVADDDELYTLLREATEGRVHPDIMSQQGLEAIRRIAAYVLEWPPNGSQFSPHEALDYVLGAIRQRIGARPNVWLNSLGVIGKRLLSPTIGHDGPDETPYRSKRRKRKKPALKLTKELRILIEADGARVLAPKLHRDAKGLNKLLRKYGPEALDTIKSCLTGAMIYESAVGQVKSWSYFVGPLEDERRATELEAQGIRPGDCPGWRNRETAQIQTNVTEINKTLREAQ